MPSLLSLALIGLLLRFLYRTVKRGIQWRENIRAAKASGLPYVIVPVQQISRPWLIAHPLLMPYIRRLPRSWTSSWIDVVTGDWYWEQQYSAFAKRGADTFLTASPWGISIYTADADVISQVTTRRNDFPKPIRIYKTLDIYGKNVVSLEGAEWRRHRKITAPPFTEKNNHLVWSETLFQAQTMLTSWLGRDGEKDGSAPTPMNDTMRLSLHVISRAGFDVRCLWPDVNDDDEQAIQEGAMSVKTIPSGHELSYVESMDKLLHLIGAIIIFPTWLLKYAPFKPLNLALKAKIEWGRYMREMFETKKAALTKAAASGSDTTLDLMGSMIIDAGLIPEAKPATKTPSSLSLSEDEIMGNSFVFMLAGHETAANTLHFAFVYLALNPSVQRALQADLDSIFAGRPVSEWDYDRDLPRLFGGMAGAVMNETLRLIPPVLSIPKSVSKAADQALTVAGRDCILPKGAFLSLTATCVHRNPKYWPHGPPRQAGPFHPRSNTDNDLEEFKPDRWILDAAANSTSAAAALSLQDGAQDNDDDVTRDLGVNTAPDTAASLFRPKRGAYIPFSEGYRACIGRRFAQVEILATLAVLFHAHSVELDVAAFAEGDEEEEVAARVKRGMESSEERLRVLWGKAEAHAEYLLRECMGTVITIKLRKGAVRLRFVERGREVFAGVCGR